MKTVIFSHGKESGPNGNKIKILSEVAEKFDYNTISIDYRDCKNANERVLKLQETITTIESNEIILVGSSMGGYVSVVTSMQFNVIGLFLMCPALYLKRLEYTVQEFSLNAKNIEIIHGFHDEVVPYNNSIQFAEKHKAVLTLVNDNHRLKNSHQLLEDRFSFFLEQIT